MPTYCTITAVKAEIPEGRPLIPGTVVEYTAEQWEAKLSMLIMQNSDLVDSCLPLYLYRYAEGTQRFPDITDTPATPGVIERIVRYYTACDALAYFKGSYTDDNAERLRRRNYADDLINKIQKGEIKIGVNGASLCSAAVTSINSRDPQNDDPVFNYSTLGNFDRGADNG